MKCNIDGRDKEVHPCPFCGYMFIHHGKVEVFGRNEDDNSPNHVTIERYNVTVDRSNSGNPSSRREGVRIQLWCEQCKRIHYMEISQHKGVTFIEMVDKGESSSEFVKVL